MDLIVRPAIESDFDGVSRIFEQENAYHVKLVPEFITVAKPILKLNELKAIIDRADRELLVAEMAREIIGAALVSVGSPGTERWIRPRRAAYVEDIAVEETHRRGGAGRELMKAVADWARHQGLDEIELHVWEKNRPGRAFYESLGYELTQHTMRKKISDNIN